MSTFGELTIATFRAHELTVVDDGSSEESLASIAAEHIVMVTSWLKK